MRITAIYGKDDLHEHAAEVAKEGKIEFLAEKPEDFFGKVDAVMVVYRKGSYHISDILPFVEKENPVWIDKPICSSAADIEKLKSIIASKTAEDKISIIAKYKDYQVSLNYVNSPDYFIDAIYKSVNENKEVLI